MGKILFDNHSSGFTIEHFFILDEVFSLSAASYIYIHILLALQASSNFGVCG